MEHEILAQNGGRGGAASQVGRVRPSRRVSCWPSWRPASRSDRPAGRTGRPAAPDNPPRPGQAVKERHALTLDEARPDAVERRHRHRAAHRPREHRRPVRPGQLRRVRAAGDRRPTAAPRRGGADRADPGRRPGRRQGHGSAMQPALVHLLRLHGPGRDPGDAEPPQEGPAVRARRAAAAARGAVRRGWRRSTRATPTGASSRGWTPRRSPVRAAERPGADGRRRVGLLLRRQRRPARLLRRDHRHRGLDSGWAARR